MIGLYIDLYHTPIDGGCYATADGMKHEGCIKSIMDYVAKKIGKLMGKCWI